MTVEKIQDQFPWKYLAIPGIKPSISGSSVRHVSGSATGLIFL